jgi:butyrate kinase
MEAKPLVLAINPGSTSTKLALYARLEQVAMQNFDHTVESLAIFGSVAGQLEHRLACVDVFLAEQHVNPGALAAVMGRGGLLHPLKSGVYRVNAAMKADVQAARYGEHACNLGALMADHVATRYGCPAYIADPVVVDEMADVARVSGMPDIERKSIFHALNHKFSARETAARLGRPYEELRLIVAHLGGGVSVASHEYGKVVDVNNALDGEGPFTPERSGGLPAGDLVRLALSGTYSYEQLRKRITGAGGLYAYWGSRDMRDLERKVAGGDGTALFYLQAMVYQISKEIASHAAVLEGRIDAIVLTGGMAHYSLMVDMIRQRVGFLAPVFIIPGEREMLSLAENAHAVLTGQREVMEYVER